MKLPKEKKANFENMKRPSFSKLVQLTKYHAYGRQHLLSLIKYLHHFKKFNLLDLCLVLRNMLQKI